MIACLLYIVIFPGVSLLYPKQNLPIALVRPTFHPFRFERCESHRGFWIWVHRREIISTEIPRVHAKAENGDEFLPSLGELEYDTLLNLPGDGRRVWRL